MDDLSQPDWDRWAELPGLASVLDPNDRSGAKNAIIDRVQWGALRRRIVRGDIVLDFGCGTGRFGRRISERGALYTGVDYSLQMILAARRDSEASNLEFIHFDGAQLPFAKNTFGKSICCGVFQYYSQTAKGQTILDELARILTPSGRLLIIEQVSRSGQTSGTVSVSTTEEQLCAQLRSSFKVHSCIPIRPGKMTLFTRCLLQFGRVPLFAIVAAAWIERMAMRLMRARKVARLPYYDVLIDAAPLKSIQYLAGNNPI